MFDFQNAQWHRDTCRIDDNISIRLWESQKRPDTYQVFLRWRDSPEASAVTVYKRFITAKSRNGARNGAFPVIRRWLAKNTTVPACIRREDYHMCLKRFGIHAPLCAETA